MVQSRDVGVWVNPGGVVVAEQAVLVDVHFPERQPEQNQACYDQQPEHDRENQVGFVFFVHCYYSNCIIYGVLNGHSSKACTYLLVEYISYIMTSASFYKGDQGSNQGTGIYFQLPEDQLAR